MINRSLIVLSLSLLSATALSAEEPQWLKDARAREGKPLKVASVKSADNFFTTKVPAKLVGEVAQEGDGYTLTLDIGSGAPMTCEVVKEGFDLAETLRAVAISTLADVERLQGKIEAKGVERQDAGILGTSPFMSVDWIYRVNDGGGAKIGAIKQLAASKGGHGLYCAHVELGYRETFLTVARAFVESVEFAAAEPIPQYFEISTATLGGVRVGVAITSLEKDADGDFRLFNGSSLLVPVSMDTLSSQDTFHVQWARPDASMINATHIVSTNGEIETNLSLKLLEEDRWTVEGTFNQKEIQETVASRAPPVTWLQQALSRRSLFDEKEVVGKTLVEPLWVAVSPTAFVESKLTVLALLDDKRLAIRESAAGLNMQAMIDRATGLPASVEMQVGPQTIKLERVLSRGSF